MPHHPAAAFDAGSHPLADAGYERVPQDAPRGFAPGPGPYRVLVSATDAFCGRGVSSHDAGLLGRLAHALAAATGHGVDVELARASAASPDEAIDDVRAAVQHSTDAVVLELEQRLLAAPRLGRTVEALQCLLRDGGRRAVLVLVVQAPAPPRAVAQLERLVGRTRAPWTPGSASAAAVHLHVLLPRGPSAPRTYARWGRGLAAVLAGGLRFPRHWIAAADVLDEDRRERALERLPVGEERWTDLLSPFVRSAAKEYRSRYASIATVDGTTVRLGPALGEAPEMFARHESFTDVALAACGGLLVGDARRDSRFDALPSVRSGRFRSYTGYRLRDPRGVVIGTVCVVDPDPRRVVPDDLQTLRELAADIERVIADGAAGAPQASWRSRNQAIRARSAGSVPLSDRSASMSSNVRR